MIALGSAIGMGMWLGSGQSLVNGGPASLFIGFLISSSIVWCVCQSIGEMAVMYPLPSAFVQWSTMFISPAAGFALGWGYWFSYWITIANELQVPFHNSMGRVDPNICVGRRDGPQLLD
jgi:amino acid transporter